LFRYYAKSHYYKFDVLEFLIKKCQDLVQGFSIRSLILIIRGLADLNIQNKRLLAKIRVRLQEFIDETNRNKVVESDIEEINADTLAQLINYFNKLEFLELEDYNYLETQFFIYAEKHGLKYKESVFNIIAAHCRIMRRHLVTHRESSKDGNIPIKIVKSFRNLNEDFFEKIMDYVEQYKDEFQFKSAFNTLILIRNSRIAFRSCIRRLHPIYLGFIDKFLNEMDIEKYEHEKVKEFIVIGAKLFQQTKLLEEVKERLDQNKVNLDKYNVAWGSLSK
jgi:hypothetical protein